MKIALFVPSRPQGGAANGIITYASQIAPALRQLGHEVYVLTHQISGPTDDRYTVNLSEFSPGLFWQIRSKLRSHAQNDLTEYRLIAALQKLKSDVGIDVLEIEESFGWSAALSSARIVPVVVRLHGPWFLTGTFDAKSHASFDSRVQREGLGISQASVVTSPSMAGLDGVRRHYGMALNDARVIPNPVGSLPDGSEWCLSACDKDRILFVGRFDLLKGADLVLKAFQRLARKHPRLRLTFVGPERKIADGEVSHSFEQFVEKYLPESRSRIDYLGLVNSEELIRLRKQHLFTIVASRFEMFSYAVAEAMILGCPIIASSTGGIPELISDNVTGLLFKSEDVASLAEGCERLLTQHELLSRLGSAAKDSSVKRLDPMLNAGKIELAYQAAIAKGFP
ncbi:glycosyltransferase family 4 protein [Bradyrhizobium roseum]|uniref:glycosyltransferase family 4 protein n=1 Tax=Bradyrhizobium roseum TaxID=3056648 RepID=UPI00262D1C1C|nr:glycosyltransferase family 4 protein [Bradyrhizobium roseus]WKA30621.1 glycosyltransferase family 4 protein [Bradyrhizobium roseus]